MKQFLSTIKTPLFCITFLLVLTNAKAQSGDSCITIKGDSASKLYKQISIATFGDSTADPTETEIQSEA